MTKEQLNRGDIVKLESGGPDMTVEAIVDANPPVKCIWFTARNEYSSAYFYPETLRLISRGRK